jgi:hypothetical protein
MKSSDTIDHNSAELENKKLLKKIDAILPLSQLSSEIEEHLSALPMSLPKTGAAK